MILEYLRDKLINSGVTVPVYINYSPPNPDDIILIRSILGRKPEVGLDYDFPSFQVLCRSKSHNTARTLAFKVYDTFHEAPSMLDSPIIDMQGLQSPYFAGQDEQNRYFYAQIFQTEIQRTII
jgi:hypothetical protein